MSNYLFSRPMVGSFTYGTTPDARVLKVHADETGTGMELILESFRASYDVMYQANYAFNNNAYVFSFGDRLGLYDITATSFPDTKLCADSKKGARDNTNDPGSFAYLNTLFTKHNLKSDINLNHGEQESTQIHITMGTKTLKGYFVSHEVTSKADDAMQILVKFTLLGYLKEKAVK